MELREIAHTRLRNQHLVGKPLGSPEHVVRYLTAVQAQDYTGAKWALGLRLGATTDAAIEEVIQAGRILRTHVLRPTWHFVVPDDLRWMMALSAPRISAQMAPYTRRANLDAKLLARCNAVIAKALAGGKHLTREELSRALAAAKIDAKGERLGLVMMQAEIDLVVCSGPRRGKQFTYALVDDYVPAAKPKRRDEALVELARRYFASRGPASAHDFAWWAGLAVTDAKRAIAEAELAVDGPRAYVELPRRPAIADGVVHLLPNYDEYFIGFKDRSAFAPPEIEMRVDVLGKHIVVAHGHIVGGWQRTVEKKVLVVKVTLLAPLTKAQRASLDAAAARLGAFSETPVRVVVERATEVPRKR